MKRIIISVGLILMLVLSLVNVAFADTAVSVKLDGKALDFDVPPQIINGRTMVPLRVIFEALGATVEWDNDTSTVTADNKLYNVKATIGIKTMTVNGETKEIDTPPIIIDGRTLVPVRFVAEAFNCGVQWEADTQTVIITSSLEENEANEENTLDEKNNIATEETDEVETEIACVVGKQYKSANGYGVTVVQADVKKVKGVKTLVFKYTLENLTKDQYLNEKTFIFGFTDGTCSNQGGIYLDGMYPGEKLTKTFNLILNDKELSLIMFDDALEKEKDPKDYASINDTLTLISGKIPKSYFETRLVWYFE